MIGHEIQGRLGRSISLSTFDALSTEHQKIVAETISAATSGSDENGEPLQMLPITSEDIYEKFIGVSASVDGKFGGFIGAMSPDTHSGVDMSEVGSLWVEPALRRHGIGGVLVQTVSNLLQLESIQPYAFCNPQSIRIFERHQYACSSLRDVPASAGELCAQCPKRGTRILGVECCDTVMVKDINREWGTE